MKLNTSIIKIRVALQKSNLNQSGHNKAQNFNYYELKDFLPTLNKLMLDNELNDIFSISNDEATLILTNGEESNTYKMPFIMFDTPTNIKTEWVKGTKTKLVDKEGDFVYTKSMQDIQYLGALNTYYKRYLYLNAFGITDGEVIDGMDNDELKPLPPKPHQPKPNYTPPKDERGMFEKGVELKLASIMKAFDKAENSPHKLTVLKNVCEMYKVNGLSEIRFKDDKDLDKLVSVIKTQIETEKALANNGGKF